MIGGYISRNLANILYGSGNPEEADYDLIVEHLNDEIALPKGWECLQNSFGNPKIVHKQSKTEIDLVPLTNIHSIKSRDLSPTIDNFLKGTPLNIQSLCYEIDTAKLVGEAGIKALETKTISIHNRDAAEHRAKMKSITPEDLATEVAKSFSFKVEL